MAKQRLVDFRGGINQKISSHMIGDSQGQSAEDVDLSSVRLQGRIKIDASQKAGGSFFYESGNLASNIFDGRWVSIFSEDTDTYLTGATDFALWNKDLYVAFGPDSLNGVLQVYRDGSTSANPLTFEEPSSLTVTTHNYSNSNGFLAPYSSTVPSEVLIQSVAGIDYVPPQTGVTVTASNASQFNPPYILGSYNSSHSRYEWTQSGDPNTYYSTSQTTGNIQQNTGGSAAYTVTLSLSTVGQFSPPYVDSGQNFSDTRSGTSSHSFDIFTRSGVNTNYYYTSTSNSTLNVVAGNFYTQSGGGTTGGNTVYDPTNTTTGNYDTNNYWSWEKYPDFPSGNVTESNYTDLDWSSQSYSSYDTNWTDTRTGTSNQVFNRYQDSSGTLYYAPQSTLVSPYTGLTAGVFYTQSGGGYDSYEVCDPSGNTSGRYGTSSYYFRWVRDSGNSSVGTLSIAWDSSVVYTQSNVAEGSIPTSVNNTENNTVYTYTRINFKSEYSNNDTKNYSLKRCYTVPSNIQDYTYTAHTRSEAPTTGDTTFQWGGATKHTQSNVTYANALTSKQLTENSVNYTYQRATTQQVNTNDLKKFGIFRSYVTAVTNVNYTYTLHTNTRTFPATYTYANITDTIPEIIGKPETPDFTYDDARTKLYLEYQNDSDVGSETIDNAQGVNWLVNRDFSLTDDGYYLKTLREETVNNVALPVVSTDSIKATLSSGSNWVFGNTLSNLESTPQRLNFTIGAPSDAGIVSFPLKGYKLERKDSISMVDLGYIAPDTSVTFSYNSSTNAISISGLDTTTPGDYRLKYAGYQDTEVQITLNSGTPTTAKADMTGLIFDGSDTLAIELVNGVDTRFLAADFWLEKRIFDTDASTDTDDIYAVIRCFDVFDRNGNAVTSGVIQGTCDFLDVFPNGVSSGGLTSDSQQAGAPTYLKFLKEANNFFFAVGTEDTPDARYGSSTNKADSFLFVSEYNNPRSWPLTGYVEFDGPITGLAPYQGELIVWTQSGTFRVTGSRYDQMRKSKIATTEGMPEGHHRSIAQVNRYLVWVSQSGICIYNGESVSNITRSRFNAFNLSGSSVHAGQFDDTYYVVDDSEAGYAVDFAMEGFPIAEIDLKEGSTSTPSNANGDTLPPVLVYRPSVNKLYTRRGVIEGSVGNRNLWTYKTRGFDGGAFGSIKLIRNVTINGTGSGKIQIYLDNKPVFKDSNGDSDPQTVEITTSIRTEPARVYVPPTSDTLYGLSVADVWSVELIDWDGIVDWIDTEYEILSGG